MTQQKNNNTPPKPKHEKLPETCNFTIYEEGTSYEVPEYRLDPQKGLVSTGEKRFIQFVRGSKLGSDNVRPRDGILHETLLAMMIEDLSFKHKLVPSEETKKTLEYLLLALGQQLIRAEKRKAANKQGTYQK